MADDATTPDHPTTNYPSRYVGWFGFDEHDENRGGFVIMLAGSYESAVTMMRDQFGNNWDYVWSWAAFVRKGLTTLLGAHRMYATGNDETAWRHGEPIYTMVELFEATK